MKEKIAIDVEKKMEGIIDFFKKEISALRAGRASISLLEGILVDYYGTKMPINQIATVTIPQPQLIVIQPWDKNMLQEITKAIQSSNIGLNPLVDSNVIKVPVPPLSEERRQELVKILQRMGEEAKIEIREIRRKGNDEMKKSEKDKLITEDDMHKGIEKIQKTTDKFVEEIDKRIEEKSKDILEG